MATTGTLYVNGQVAGTNTSMTVHPADLGSTTQDYLGRSQFPTDPYLNGEIDDVGVCSSALSATQIAALASGQPAAGDVADYKFDETGGATATDSSGHGHDAFGGSNAQAPDVSGPTNILAGSTAAARSRSGCPTGTGG